MKRETLSALPAYVYGRECGANEKVWTEAALRMYARTAVAAERERCAHWTALHDHEGFAHHCIVSGREIGA